MHVTIGPESFAEKALYFLDFGNLVLVMGVPDDTGIPSTVLQVTNTQKALVNSLESRDLKHLRISLARNEALATI